VHIFARMPGCCGRKFEVLREHYRLALHACTLIVGGCLYTSSVLSFVSPYVILETFMGLLTRSEDCCESLSISSIVETECR